MSALDDVLLAIAAVDAKLTEVPKHERVNLDGLIKEAREELELLRGAAFEVLEIRGMRSAEHCLECGFSGGDGTMSELCDARGTIVDADTVTDNITIPRDLYELLKEAAEKWAEGCIYKTFNPETVADFACTHCDRKGDPIEHTADCKAARILGLKREGEG